MSEAQFFLEPAWQGNRSLFRAGLIERELYLIDWPYEDGGSGRSRREQLTIVSQLAATGCPLPPDSLFTTAPILLAHGTPNQKQRYLPILRKEPHLWNLTGQQLEKDGSSTFLINDEVLGEVGAAEHYLATCHSSILQLLELKTTLHHIQSMLTYWQSDDTAETELQITIAALEALFLIDDQADEQIAAQHNKLRDESFSLLFQSLGYYALLTPDSLLSSNESLPFEDQRLHLHELMNLTSRNSMQQHDHLFSHSVAET